MNNLTMGQRHKGLSERKFHDVFFNDVIEGLNRETKCLPAKYFYDDLGSALFEEICELDEYYVTRAEIRLLEKVKYEIANIVGSELAVIEPGSGAAIKVQILLSALQNPAAFMPLEISEDALSGSMLSIQENFPDLTVYPLHGDFTRTSDLQKLPLSRFDHRTRLVFFPGSTIGNFECDEAVSILSNLRDLAGNSGWVMVGIDLLKDRVRLFNAYNDSQGITEKFNKNILQRINRELGGNFDVNDGFEHIALFNEQQSRIEMHLVSTRDQIVRINEHSFAFLEGESIHTENSHKYSVESFQVLAAKANLQNRHIWIDEEKDFALLLLQSRRW